MYLKLWKSLKFFDDYDFPHRDSISSQVLWNRSEAKENVCLLHSLHYQDGSKCGNSLPLNIPYIQSSLPWRFITQLDSFWNDSWSHSCFHRPLLHKIEVPWYAWVLLHKCGWICFPSEMLFLSFSTFLLSDNTDANCFWDFLSKILHNGSRLKSE